MLKLEELYAFLERNFDYFLAIDENNKIIHANPQIVQLANSENRQIKESSLGDVLTEYSMKTFTAAITDAETKNRGLVIFTPQENKTCTLPLRAGYSSTVHGDVYLFFGNRVGAVGGLTEKDERIKELQCLYSVGEWIESSNTMEEFFGVLPGYLKVGMGYSDAALVYINYQGTEYGENPQNYLSVDLVRDHQVCGEIRAGYDSDKYALLPEEQQMLDEIGRMIGLALERRALSNRLEDLQEKIDERAKTLEEQTGKLQIVDSYLERVNEGWEESRVRLEALFEAIPDDVVLIDRNRNVVMTNRKEVETGSKCYHSYFDRDTPCQDCRLARIIKSKTPLTLTIRQDDRYLQVYAMPVYNQNHEVDAIIEFYRDITLEMTYEQQIQQADKMASLGQLVSGIGHEINNPNQFIRGNIKIIKQALDDILPIVDEYHKDHPDLKVARLKYDFFREHVLTLIDDMARGSERIKGIVQGLRTFIRRDEGLFIDAVEINTIIEDSVRLVHDEVSKQAEIQLDLCDEPPSFTGNALKIEQVMVNLIMNAGQAMLDGRKGKIAIRTTTNQAGEICIEVEDNGKGMNDQTSKQIFDPFFTTKRSKGGTGLGLAIAYRIVEEHDGQISVASKSGMGTKFTIRIPTSTDKS